MANGGGIHVVVCCCNEDEDELKVGGRELLLRRDFMSLS